MGWEQQSGGAADRGAMVMASAAPADAHALASYREDQAPPRDATAVGATAWRGLCTAVGAAGVRDSTSWSTVTDGYRRLAHAAVRCSLAACKLACRVGPCLGWLDHARHLVLSCRARQLC